MSDVIDNKAASRFELETDGLLSIAEYRIADGAIYFTHTEVPPQLGGRGVAGQGTGKGPHVGDQGDQVVAEDLVIGRGSGGLGVHRGFPSLASVHQFKRTAQLKVPDKINVIRRGPAARDRIPR